LFDKAISDFNNTGLSATRNRELILQHLSVAPQVIKQYIGETPSAKNPKALEDLNKLSGEIYDASQSKNEKDFQKVINKLGQIIGKSTLIIPAAPVTVFNAITLDLFKTANQEMIYEEGVGYRGNISNPEKQFEFYVQREIISSGNADGLQLKLVKQSELENDETILNTNSDNNPNSYVLIPVDKDGKVVKFNEIGKPAVEGYTPVITFKQTKFELNFWIKERVVSMMSRGSSLEQATLQAEQEVTGYLNLVDAMKKKHASGEAVGFSINIQNSSMGMVEENIHKKTQMNTVTNVQEIPITVKKKGIQTIALMHVPLFMDKKTMSDEKPMYENSLANITEDELDLLTKLITEPNLQKKGTKKETGDEYQSEMRAHERREAIYHFHKESTAEFLYFNKKERSAETNKIVSTNFMIINNQKFEAALENAEVIRQALKDYFTTRTFELYAYSTKFTNVVPFESFDKTTDINQLFYGKDGKVYITKGAKRNLRIKDVTDIDALINVPVSIEGNVVSLGNKTIRQHILDNTNTTIITNSNNELRGYSTFLALGVTAKEVADLEVAEDEIDDDVFFRTLAESNMETEPTEAQKEAAMNWFRNHPLFKVLNLNESLRNKIHEKGPSFVAEFVNSSINLYLGSNNTDIYHEAFHAFTQAILTEVERKAMYSEIAKTPGTFKVTVLGKTKTVAFATATDLEIEEYLAEKFREYSMNRGKSKVSVRIKQFFDKVLNLLEGMFGKNMTFNEAIALNKSAGVVNTMFNALYEGNIDVSKFNPQAVKSALYKSSEINVPDVDFSLEEVNVLMESMQSLMSEFIDFKTSGVFDKKVNKQIATLQIESANYPVGSKKHDAVLKKIDKLKKKVGVVNGYGMFAVAKSPEILESALTFIQKRLIQQRDLIKSSVTDKNDFALTTLNKAIDAFGDVESAMLYLDAEENTNLIGLFLNNYSNVQIEQEDVDYYDTLSDEERALAYTFGKTGTEQSLAERTDAQTKQLLSSIHAHSNNGKGPFVVNALGIKKIQPFVQMLAKTSKVLRNTTDRVEMHKKLVEAAKKDFEIAQILAKLGDINNPNITQDEQKAWLAFWQVMNKTDLFLREFIIEKVVETKNKTKQAKLISRSGRAKSASNRVGKDWADNFVFLAQSSPYFKTDKKTDETAESEPYLFIDEKSKKFDLVEDYEDVGFGLISGSENSPTWINDKDERIEGNTYTGKLVKAAALPFDFLKEIGIDLVEDPLVREILTTGSDSLGVSAGIVSNILKSLINRQTAVLEKDKKPTSLRDLFQGFDYIVNGERFTQPEMNGWFTQLQNLQYFFSDENSSSMGKNAEGENQSEKSDNSSLSVMVSALNDAKHYDEILNGSGLEVFNVQTNPFAAASPWLINMFNLDSTNPAVRGTRNSNFKITVESLSGSKIIFENDDKGSGTIKLDEKAKFISDFETTAAELAIEKGYHYVICGHIHEPKLIRKVNKDTPYSELKRNLKTSFLQPNPIVVSITQSDIKTGYISRYFVKKLNELLFVEIDELQFKAWQNGRIDPNSYFGVQIRWYISGPVNDETQGVVTVKGVRTKNTEQIAYAQRFIPGISNVLTDPLQYYSDNTFKIPVDINQR
jgi:hypothetical protein